MTRSKRSLAMVAGDREAQAIAATLGRHVRERRHHQRLRLVDLGDRIGLSVNRLSMVERGHGEALPLRAWVRIGAALGEPLAVNFTPPIGPARLADAGHLELQEWVLAMARRRGWKAGFEIPTRPADPRRSADVVIHAGERIVLIECWNTIGDFGAAVRSTTRKLAEAEALAVAVGATAVTGCWLVRPTAANRALVRAYPEAIRAAFRASSTSWARTLIEGASAPEGGVGFAWLDPKVGPRAIRLRVR
jgi:hypothetical protein